MPKRKPASSTQSSRVSIIKAITSPLSFCVLIALIAEGGLGALAAKQEGTQQLVAMGMMVLVMIALVSVVVYMATHNLGALMGWRAQPRTQQTADAEAAEQAAEFSKRISGYWWERITPDSASALSLVQIDPDPSTNTVKLKGDAYAKDLSIAAVWESEASCVHLSSRKVFYYWKGHHPGAETTYWDGFGEISFKGKAERPDSGSVIFSSTSMKDAKDNIRKTAAFRRLTPREIEIVEENNPAKTKGLVRDFFESEKLEVGKEAVTS